MSSLNVQNVSVRFGKKVGLADVSLPRLERGEMLGLLGPNAAGKSTLMRAIVGTQNHSGSVSLDGKRRQEYSHNEWHTRVAFMPQSPPQASALKPIELMWSAARSLALPLSDKHLAQQIESIFKALELDAYALTPLQELSGGKRQLVGLCLCLLRQPRLLLLDEPTSALDLYWRMVVLDLVNAHVKREGAVAIAALHDIDLAIRYCDKLAIIAHGQIVATGTPKQVITSQNLKRIYHVDAEVSTGIDDKPIVQIKEPIRGLNHHEEINSHI